MDRKSEIPLTGGNGMGAPYRPYPGNAVRHGTLLIVCGSFVIVSGIIQFFSSLKTDNTIIGMVSAIVTIVCGAVVIAAVKTKPSNPSASRALFITSIVLFALSLIGSLVIAIWSFTAAGILGTAMSRQYDPDVVYTMQVLMYISIAMGVVGVLGAILAILVITLSAMNLRSQ